MEGLTLALSSQLQCKSLKSGLMIVWELRALYARFLHKLHPSPCPVIYMRWYGNRNCLREELLELFCVRWDWMEIKKPSRFIYNRTLSFIIRFYNLLRCSSFFFSAVLMRAATLYRFKCIYSLKFARVGFELFFFGGKLEQNLDGRCGRDWNYFIFVNLIRNVLKFCYKLISIRNFGILVEQGVDTLYFKNNRLKVFKKSN